MSEPTSLSQPNATEVAAAYKHLHKVFAGKAPAMSREELLEARRVIATGRPGVLTEELRDNMLARIDAHIHSLDTGEPVVEPPKPKTKARDVIAGLAVIAVPLVIVTSCIAASDGDSGSGSDGRQDTMAAVMCEQFIEERLLSPSSAEFPWASDYAIAGTGNSYTVRGYVDAENAFGASLRRNWTCSLQHNPTEDSWTLIALTGIE